ncbi:MAG: glycosyltransferase [Fimbriimonadales bacterium]|nr:glycosyltransferase [Fimbriimonadales bacterium]
MSEPLISVIINNYNYGRFLTDAIESALAQTYPRKEILIVDDGSTDNSREIIARYEGRVRAILKENGGHASTFNIGFQHARGDVICFLDSDDYWAPSLLERVASVWRDGLSFVEWRMECVDAEGKPLGKQLPGRPPMQGDLRSRLLRVASYPWTPTSGNAFARRVLEVATPIDTRIWRYCAEAPLLLIAPFYGELAFIDEPLAYYRIHGSNFVPALPPDWKRLESETRVGLSRERVIREHAARQGLKPHPRLRDSVPRLNLFRLILLLAGRAIPEMQGDTRWKLAFYGVQTVLTTDLLSSWQERWGYMRPLILSLIAPRKALQLAARWVFWNATDEEIRRFLTEAGR